jgi:hypothetical protein
LYHTIGVEVPCSCVGQDPQWDVSDESLQAALPLILITSFGELPPLLFLQILIEATVLDAAAAARHVPLSARYIICTARGCLEQPPSNMSMCEMFA